MSLRRFQTEDTAHERLETWETQPPLRQVAQQEMDKEPRPDLPLDRVLAVADEVVKLACLFQHLEEQLGRPLCAVELRHGLCRPLEIVREEDDHLPHLSAHLDHGRDAPERAVIRRVLSLRPLAGRTTMTSHGLDDREGRREVAEQR